MRPLFYVDDDPDLLTRTDGYLWGDAFLVYPVTDPLPLDDEGQRADTQALEVYFPDGANWYGFFDGARYAGGQRATVEVTLEELPVFVKGGSFVPMIPPVQTLDDYPHDEKTVHFYYDATVTKSTAQLYEDDGMTPETYTKGAFEIFDFVATVVGDDGLDLRVERSGGEFPGRSEELQYDWVIHHWPAKPDAVTADDGTSLETVVYDAETRQLRFTTEWDDRELVIRLR